MPAPKLDFTSAHGRYKRGGCLVSQENVFIYC